ncbi:helix-turn-helix domain-containing protein, partial [Peterkaempfera griseoplana]|uniref:helix-turn-helix domain-containing protein n=1 Tax=Peterkaempfera griseoplana TaxID=66896 RepID=UPI0006E27FD6
MSNRQQSDRIQSVRTAWVNRLRAEVLRYGSKDLAGVARVGVWLASFADADGSNAFPSRETLATLSGGSKETVTRATAVLEAGGMLAKRRRPNQSAVYQLTMPAGPVDWASVLYLYTDNRQRRARAAAKAAEMEAVLASAGEAHPEGVRGRSPEGVPDGCSGRRPRTLSEDPEGVRG